MSFSNQNSLARNDKHFLGGGKKVIWAPEFPLFIDKPGFWDHACFLNYKIEPLFNITFLDENLNELNFKLQNRRWLPNHLTQGYEIAAGLEIEEQKALLPTDLLVSYITIKSHADHDKKINLIVWSCQYIQQKTNLIKPERKYVLKQVHALRSRISWEKQVFASSDEKPTVTIGATISAQKIAQTNSVNASDFSWNYPDWKLTPFYEKITPKGLPDQFHYDPQKHVTGLLYLELQYELSIPAQQTSEFSVYCAINKSEQAAIEAFDEIPKNQNPIATSIKNWDDFFNSIPQFHCSNPYLEKYYYCRWYVLRLNTVATQGEFNLPYPCIFEGTNAGWFRHQISYIACAHLFETRWMHTPEVAQGILLNFIAHQREDGSFYGGIMTGNDEIHVGFYHANWGYAIRQLHRIHPNFSLLEQVYKPLVRYAIYFQQERDRENWHLYDVINHWETGQEFPSRYLVLNSDANRGETFRLKGVDTSVYLYGLQKNLAWIAKELGNRQDSRFWEAEADKTKQLILSLMWDDTQKLFVDVDPSTGKKSPVKTVVSFYPFMTDIVGVEHLEAFEHLFNPNEFWTDYPVSSTSLDDYYAYAYGEWKEKRLNCPWNGRSWLITNSHVCDTLSEAALHLDPQLKLKAVELIEKCINMLFLEGDLNRPSSYEYYNSLNGKAPCFRGTDDYMHSWIVDLIIKYVVGFQPGDGNIIVVDPLPFGLTHFTLDNAIVKDRVIKIERQTEDPVPQHNGLFM